MAFTVLPPKDVGRPLPLNVKTSLRNLLSPKRCLVPADGFYEWMAPPQGKLPHRFQLKNEKLFSFGFICFGMDWQVNSTPYR
ncbi:SOS response-associated peptidase family protein [Rufibacter glacialis]|uniref:SOS response-associated peptidase n=1 Tax=Rufibacter glacialis TaxID=1259555 RepID=A0A5M8QCJ1_9BACT|nr:SOS response-associated peptidase family protein [Rufibacter glacialis]KAA6432536.1 SOS response-associated peptidase [Rufibacter glacialis]